MKTESVEVRSRAAPVLEIETGKPLTLAIELDATTADWIVRQARMKARGTRSMRHAPLFASFVLVALAGCAASSTVSAAASGRCDEQAAQRLVGKTKPTDADAMRLTGATIVRQITPGQPVTMDYSDSRVTIETDPATGRVVRAMCG